MKLKKQKTKLPQKRDHPTGTTLSHFKQYYKDIVIKTKGIALKTDTWTNRADSRAQK